MKKTLFSLLIIALLTCVVTTMSCNKAKECKTCNQDPVARKNIELKLGNAGPLAIEVPVWIKPNAGDLNYGDQRLNENQFKQLNAAIDKNANPEVIVLYLNKNLLDINAIGMTDIKGISTFTIADKLLIHHFYELKDGRLQKDPLLELHTNSLSMSAVLAINSGRLKSDKSSVLLLDRRPGNDFVIQNKFDVLGTVARHYDDIKKSINAGMMGRVQEDSSTLDEMVMKLAVQYGGESGGCGGFCYTGKGTCVRDLKQLYPPSWYCLERQGGGGGCKATQLESDLTEARAASTEDISAAFDNDLHYAVRDQLLSTNARGEKYRNYYYYFSDVYIGEADLTLALKTMNTLIKMNVQLRKLKDGGHDDEIFLDESLRDEVMSIINDYRKIYTDYNNELLINDFINDMNELMLNRRIGEVRPLFQ